MLWGQGVSQSLLHKAVRCALDEAADNLTDFLPEHIRAARYLFISHSHENQSGALEHLIDNGFTGTSS